MNRGLSRTEPRWTTRDAMNSRLVSTAHTSRVTVDQPLGPAMNAVFPGAEVVVIGPGAAAIGIGQAAGARPFARIGAEVR